MPELHSITFIWPFMAWALALLPVLAVAYALRPRRPGLVWAVLLLVGLGVLFLALMRPRAVLLLPARTEAVMLVMDSSGSMRADDVKPSRMEAARAVARTLLEQQPFHVKLGIVSASGTAAVVQAPSADRDALTRALDRLQLQTGTALGSGMVIGLAAMLPGSGLDVNQLLNPELAASAPGAGAGQRPAAVPQVRREPGSNDSAVLVVISDGQSNVGPDPIKMAQVAADLGVRVFTIGIGTPQGAVLRAEGIQARVKLDEAPLQRIAQISGGAYFRAASAQDIAQIYQTLGLRMRLQKHQSTEVTALLLLVGMALVLAGALGNFWRNARVV